MINTRKLTHLAIFTAFALVIHSAEALLPAMAAVPGAKPGLANIITLLVLLTYGLRSAILVAMVRTILSSIIIGNFFGFGFALSFAGAIASALVMALGATLWRRDKLSPVAVSILGAVAHNTTQVSVASVIIGNFHLLRLYLPLLLLLALPTGFFTGLAVVYALRALKRTGWV